MGMGNDKTFAQAMWGHWGNRAHAKYCNLFRKPKLGAKKRTCRSFYLKKEPDTTWGSTRRVNERVCIFVFFFFPVAPKQETKTL